MEEFAVKGLGTEDFHELIVQKIYPILGCTLDEACCAWENSQALDNTEFLDLANLYFWPGYDTAEIGTESTRLTARLEDPLLSPLFGDIPCGLRRMCSSGLARPEVNGSAAAFLCLLAPCPDAVFRGRPYSPPSTHAWMPLAREVSGNARYAFPAGLIVLSNASKIPDGFDETSLLVVAESSAEGIAEQLANADVLPSWPTSQIGQIETPGLVPLWLALYDVWLAANRSTEEALEKTTQLEVLIENLTHKSDSTDLSPLAYRVQLFRKWAVEIAERGPILSLENWYTLRLARGLVRQFSAAPGAGLGTLMLLSPEQLPPGLLFAIRDWIQEVFFSLRRHEESVIHESIGEIRGQVELQEGLGHQVYHLSEALAGRWWCSNDANSSYELVDPSWGVSPVPEVFKVSARVLATATLRIDALKHVLNPWPYLVRDLARQMFLHVLESDIPFRLAVYSALAPEEFRARWNELQCEAQDIAATSLITPGPAESHFIQTIETEDGEIIASELWGLVAYYLLVAFQNCVEHGDLPVVVSEAHGDQSFSLEIRNAKRKPFHDRTTKGVSLIGVRGTIILERIRDSLNALPDVVASLEQRETSTSYRISLTMTSPEFRTGSGAMKRGGSA